MRSNQLSYAPADRDYPDSVNIILTVRFAPISIAPAGIIVQVKPFGKAYL